MHKLIKMFVSLAVLCLFFLPTVTSDQISSIEKELTREDFDPTVDIAVTVDMLMIRSFEKHDRQVFFREYIDLQTEPDFYLKVIINDEVVVSPVWENIKYIYSPDWSATVDVPDDEEQVDIVIQLWDAKDESFSQDRLCDISGDTGLNDDSFDVELIYNIKTGHWQGDDYLTTGGAMDPSGYGRLNGCDDGTIYMRNRDCELVFSISQNDADNDGIPYWMEVYTYGSDPLVDNTGEDADNDNCPFEWEWKWGFDPLTYENHENIDPENDGINNYEEYLTSKWGSDPFRKDLFVELDQMEEGPQGETSIFPEGAKELLYTAYNRQNVVYHLDDGDMGGGEFIPFIEEVDHGELNQIYQNYFLHNDQETWRRGVFHYGVLVYGHTSVGGAMFGPNRYYITSRGHEHKAEQAFMDRDEVFASAYMHECGHTLGFWPIPGHSRNAMYPWQPLWWLWRPYKSCMNYGYMYMTVDYSDGTRGLRDLDDWDENRMNLKYFQNEW